MSTLTAAQIYFYAREAGFTPDQAVTMTALAEAESGGNTLAHAQVGEDSRGLWQINVRAHPSLADVDLYDPLTNARHAYEISAHGADVSAWSTAHNVNNQPMTAPYAKFVAMAQAAAVAYGDPAGLGNFQGTTGYGDPVSASSVGAPTVVNDHIVTGGSATAPGVAPSTGDPLGDASAPSPLSPSLNPVTSGSSATSGTPITPVTPTTALDARVADDLAAGRNPYLIDSTHIGVSEGYEQVLSGTHPANALVQGFDAEYLSERGAASGLAAAAAVSQPASADVAALHTTTTTGPTAPGNSTGTGAEVVALVKSEVGKPYIWDSPTNPDTDTPAGFDCSGLAEWAYKHIAGVDITHYSPTQYAALAHRPLAQAQPGDLAFFKDATGFIHHTAIIAGTNPATGRLQIVTADDFGIPVQVRDLTDADVMPEVGVFPGSTGPAAMPSDTSASASTASAVADPGHTSLSDLVAAELRRGDNPFLTDTDHTGESDGYRLLLHDGPSIGAMGRSSGNSDTDLVHGFEIGYADQHPGQFDLDHPH